MSSFFIDYINFVHEIKDRKIIAFGIGKVSEFLSTALPFNISYYVDNNSLMWNQYHLNKPIYSPMKLLEEELGNIGIIIMSSFYPEISKQLTDLGFEENINFWNLADLCKDFLSYQKMLDQYCELVKFDDTCFINSDCSFEGNNILHDYVTLNNTMLGKYTYIASRSVISNTNIGRFCSIGPECLSGLGKHPTRGFISTYPAFFSVNNLGCKCSFVNSQAFCESSQINIGNDVWIGARVVICDGINIGDGAIIGAGSIVTKDVEPYCVVAGNPAKLIRKRYSQEKINFLLKFKWWDKDIEWLKLYAELFSDETAFFSLENI